MRVLRNYDADAADKKLVEELPIGQRFQTHDGRVFEKGEKLRKRFRCVEVKTGKVYLFSGIYEVRREE